MTTNMGSTDFPFKFTIPLAFDIEKIPCNKEPVCVVAVIGKSQYNVNRSKASLLNLTLQNQTFEGSLQDENSNVSSNLCDIEGYYHSEEHVIYLHLKSGYDTAVLVQMCQRAADDAQGGTSLWHRAEYSYVRGLLYIFSVSHIVMLVHPGNNFDISYVRLFKILEKIRVKLQPTLSEHLKGLPVSKEWIMGGRPCSPRVLFVFESCSIDPDTADSDTNTSRSRGQKMSGMKRLQHAVEDQIYTILRRSRVITNISNNSLFAVPANQEFVYINSRATDGGDPVQYYLDQLYNHCAKSNESDTGRSHSYKAHRRGNREGSPVTPKASFFKKFTERSSKPVANSDRGSFHTFLWQHVQLALTKGFDDNMGRNPLPAYFELPEAGSWFRVNEKVHNFFMVDQMDMRSRTHFNTLKSLLEVDIRFSEGRCAKVLPIAESAYQEGLPQHYTKTYHLNKLLAAKHVFLQQARGPAGEKYLEQLEADCHKLWTNGRQLCEQVSLTGNHCINQLHRLTDDAVLDENQHLPVMMHNSSGKTRASCNCGRKQAEREDPFDIKTANYDFYQKLELVCCHSLDHYELPVFKPSTSEIRAAATAALVITESGTQTLLAAELHSPKQTRTESGRYDSVHGMSNLSYALSLGQSCGSDAFSTRSVSPHPDEVSAEATSAVSECEKEDETEPARQASTIEYLPGMIHSDSPGELLPKFPSWAITSLGKSTVYNASHGLDQPGHMMGCSYLLPWDLTIPVDRERWPSVSETNKKSKMKKTIRPNQEPADVNVRLYIGVEYECPRGHRFFLSAPDKVFKPHGPAVKESAHKVLNSNLSLYFPCQCRSSKGSMAQLMRICVVAPEGPYQVEMDLRVQPAPSPCPHFMPSPHGPLLLNSGNVWMIRLPYVYMGEHGVYMMPTEPQLLASCYLHSGFLTIPQLQHG